MSSRESVFKHCEVFVVDDEPQLRSAIGDVILKHHMVAHGFECATDFLAHVRQRDSKRPQCVVCDAHLPDISGFDVKRELVAQGNDLPIILLTSSLDEKVQRRAGLLGVFAVLEKPCDPVELVNTIRNALAAHQRQTG